MNSLEKYLMQENTETEFKALHQKEKYKYAIHLFCAGKNQKEIATEIGVTEQTVGRWVNPLKMNLKNYNEILKEFCSKLRVLIKDKKTAPKDIKTLVKAMIDFKNTFLPL